MTARRAARGTPATANTQGPPPELSSRVHPFWADFAAVMAKYGHWLDDADERAMQMGRRVYYVVLRRWALEHGYESTTDPGRADFHALRRAGVITESPALLRHEGRARHR